MNMTLPDALGLFGVFLTLIAYLFLNIKKIPADSVAYAGLNIVGSTLIIYSLYFDFNISAFAMEVCWLLISVYGLYKCLMS
ncbi:MAG: hypothetical protein SFW07_02645 [Gammaproteobacteria bacterium]|nr:hypothetical protein [Gammaproteobacteria bacterium]